MSLLAEYLLFQGLSVMIHKVAFICFTSIYKHIPYFTHLSTVGLSRSFPCILPTNGTFHPCLLDVSLLAMGSYTLWLPHLDHQMLSIIFRCIY